MHMSTTVELEPSASHWRTVMPSQKRAFGVHTVMMQFVPTQASPAGQDMGSLYVPFDGRQVWMRPSGVHCVDMPMQLDGEHWPPLQLWLSPQWPSGIQAVPVGLHCSTTLPGPQRNAPGGQLVLSGQVDG